MTQLIRKLLLFALVVTLGCTPKVIKMDDATRKSLSRTQKITAIHYIPPEFDMPLRSAYAGAIGGLISEMIARSQGERIVEQFELQDPVLHVKQSFIEMSLNEFADLNISQISAPFENDDIHVLKKQFPKGYILDFQTRRWGIVEHSEGWQFLQPSELRDYRKATFIARARLIDLSQESVLWQGTCDVEDQKNIFTMEDVKYWYKGKDNSLDGIFKILTFMCAKELGEQFANTQSSSQ